MEPTWIAALIAGLAGLAGAIITGFITYQKIRQEKPVTQADAGKISAEADQTISKTWLEIYTIAKQDLNAARTEVASLKGVNAQLEAEIEKRDQQRERDVRIIRANAKQIAALSAQLVDCGQEPYKLPYDDELGGAGGAAHRAIDTGQKVIQEEKKTNGDSTTKL